MNSTLTPHPQLSIWNQVWLSPNTPIPSSILKMWTSPPAPWAPNLCTDASSSKSWDTYLSLLLRTHIQTHMPLSCYYSPPQLAFRSSLSLQDDFLKSKSQNIRVLPKSQQSSPLHFWHKQLSAYCPSTSSTGHCLPPPCSTQSISTTVLPKDSISREGVGEGHFAGPVTSQPWAAGSIYPSVLHKLPPPAQDGPGKLTWQTMVKGRPSCILWLGLLTLPPFWISKSQYFTPISTRNLSWPPHHETSSLFFF